MRVIAGTHRGRVLLGPEGWDTRPITDRVKVNLFNILRDRVDDAVVADCFCGTGSLGIECLSRDAKHVTFAETDGRALSLLKENLDTLGLADRASVLRHDVLRKGVPQSEPPANPLTLVFLDPPYVLSETAADKLWAKLCEAAATLAPNAMVVWRHPDHVELQPPPEAAGAWQITDQRTYGSQTLTFIEKAAAPPSPS